MMRVALGTLVGIACMLAVGCQRQAEPTGQGPEPAEPTWQLQVEAVQRGESDEIRIRKSVVTDADLAALDDLKDKLHRLNLSQTEITDAGLARIAQLSQLVQLRLAAPHVSDAGLAELSRLTKLRHLHLIDVPLTDSGLVHLEPLKQLESLYLDHTQATDEGFARLTKTLPNTHPHLNGGHLPGDLRGKDHRHD